MGAEHFAHTTLAQLPDDAVGSEGRANQSMVLAGCWWRHAKKKSISTVLCFSEGRGPGESCRCFAEGRQRRGQEAGRLLSPRLPSFLVGCGRGVSS